MGYNDDFSAHSVYCRVFFGLCYLLHAMQQHTFTKQNNGSVRWVKLRLGTTQYSYTMDKRNVT